MTTQPEPTPIATPALPVCWTCGFLITDEPEPRYYTAEYLAEMCACDPENEWEQVEPGTYYVHADMSECLRNLAVRMVTEG